MFRDGGMDKRYLALVVGQWKNATQHIKLPLYKYLNADGERRVMVRDDGKVAHTVFRLQKNWAEFSLLEAELKTGRTHQIRVHLAHSGFAIAGDDKYGNFPLNKDLARRGLKRMFLHAWQLTMPHPLTNETLTISVPLPAELQNFIDKL
jgi:23S rRNA pseudouridine955/2504/2580 synthase